MAYKKHPMHTIWLKKTELTGHTIQLVPLAEYHRDELLAAASDGCLWELWYTSVPSEAEMDKYITHVLEESKSGKALPFVVIHLPTGKIIGCTRYCQANPGIKRVEIGYTWYAKSHQRTPVNTECKYVMLRHAFEVVGCNSVELKTSYHNTKSKNAILRLGAKSDGIIRQNRLHKDGTIGDTAIYSILAHEWPAVRSGLVYKMKQI